MGGNSVNIDSVRLGTRTVLAFVLKFSAIEIYNECVRDLLSADATPLRLFDDPEKGTVVDKLIEIHLEDWTHLMELLAAYEVEFFTAQRKIGETSINEMSSRSHLVFCTWGSLRADMGHQEPFNLKHVAIGNQDFGRLSICSL
ncbi:putative non-reducing end alpha-L-arabinofuranosidase [Helianthus annuus]|nr:putative non-reducing end alpha-L-arabinofuranosidase [Helianthus annuus]